MSLVAWKSSFSFLEISLNSNGTRIRRISGKRKRLSLGRGLIKEVEIRLSLEVNRRHGWICSQTWLSMISGSGTAKSENTTGACWWCRLLRLRCRCCSAKSECRSLTKSIGLDSRCDQRWRRICRRRTENITRRARTLGGWCLPKRKSSRRCSSCWCAASKTKWWSSGFWNSRGWGSCAGNRFS